MAKKPVDLGNGLRFQKKGDADSYFRAILNGYRPGDAVSSTHEGDLRLLLAHHPEVASKTGSGVASFKVAAAPPEKFGAATQCFWIVRTDGSEIHFSFRECLKRF